MSEVMVDNTDLLPWNTSAPLASINFNFAIDLRGFPMVMSDNDNSTSHETSEWKHCMFFYDNIFKDIGSRT